MAQLNLNLTPAFERALARFMRVRRIKTKSEAVRVAVEEALAAATQRASAADYREWIGAGTRAPLNPKPRFRDHGSLWS
jgi:hypothetical protein